MDSLRLYKGVRTITTREEVEVLAHNYDEARELIEDDDSSVKVLSESDSDYELSGHLIEIRQ